jgi:hypothetical protein
MKSRFVVLCFVLAVASASGCSNKSAGSSQASAASPVAQPSQSIASSATPAPAASSKFAQGSDADLVRQAVEDHVRNDRGINLSAMDMSVDSVSIAGDRAQANATFRVKQGGAAMVMVYSLERQGGGWLVVNDQPAGGQFAHPPMDQAHSGMSGAPDSSAPGMPDVQEFLKTHPAKAGSSQAQ